METRFSIRGFCTRMRWFSGCIEITVVRKTAMETILFASHELCKQPVEKTKKVTGSDTKMMAGHAL